ncbi:MAG: DinB family protein [Bacteroidetes bacterium]|nr:DinB family protein [Bacteroidota bacterium]
MKFSLEKSIEILERAPSAYKELLNGVSDEWSKTNEGQKGDEKSWSPYDVIGHLIHGEKGDWMNRIEIILSDGLDKNFKPFDRFAQFEESKGKSLKDLLGEFMMLRIMNLEKLKAKNITEADLDKKGIHPAFGEVTLRQLLSTWVVHDLNHLAQVTRVMANQYKDNVGPWSEYLRILK